MTRAFASVTGAYWAFMLTDGALRMLVLLHFHGLGFSPIQLAYLFVLYEIAGVITNLYAGWIAARVGLAATLLVGLALQVLALVALALLDPAWGITASVAFVMAVQGMSGVAKDLSKTSAKSAVKVLAPEAGLFKWVAVLTGSKNAIKGLGFFVGAGLLAGFGFTWAVLVMAGALLAVLALLLITLPRGLPDVRAKPKFREVFSTDARINWLSLARLFLFGARDVWFVVGVPIFLKTAVSDGTPEGAGWAFFVVGGFMAIWIILYGAVQANAPRILGQAASVASAGRWAWLLAMLTGALAVGAAWLPSVSLIIAGLFAFGFVFALNSSVHSYLILAFSRAERVSMDVGFYYMANAGGRLIGTLLSGVTYQIGGLPVCLATAAVFAAVSALALKGITQG